VLNPADVLVHGHPRRPQLRIKRPTGILRVAEPEKVPGGVHESVRGIGSPLSVPSAGRTSRLHLGACRGQRRNLPSRGSVVQLFRQEHGTLILRHVRDSARFAVHDRDGRSPSTAAWR